MTMLIPNGQSDERAANDFLAPRASPRPRAASRVMRSAFSTMTAVAALLAAARPALAAPTGGTVVDGSASISQSGSVTNINQSTNRAVIDWLGFSISANEAVNFYQPSSLSVTLNRVIGNEQSVIAGALNANGRVFIVNSAGVLFTKDAQVNVGGLVASTLDISNKDFMAGNYRFSGSSSAAVVNHGTIRATDGGYVALLGRTVANEGVITATLGSIALASGDQITLNFSGDSLVDVTIDKGTYKALVENKGLIQADGGRVVMTAKAADAVLSAQVNNSGIVQARTLADLTGGAASQGTVRIGKIKLLASGGTTKVSGKLDASAPNGGRGGTIDTSGDKVKVADDAVITTKSASGQNGDWIIDPDGFTIAASGGDITGTALSQRLELNNVAIYSTQGGGSSGNIDVNDAVSWAASTTLTFNATKNININAPIYASGASAGVVLNFGGYATTGSVEAGTDYTINAGGSVSLLGDNASLSINGQAYTLLHNLAQLAGISAPILDSNGQWALDADGNPLFTVAEGHYALAGNIDALGQTHAAPPILLLRGTLAGLGHTVDNLKVQEPSLGPTFNAALIGIIGRGATVRDLGLRNVDIESRQASAAGLAAVNVGTIDNVFVTGRLKGVGATGGLVTQNAGTISNSYTDVAITATGLDTGGLVAENFGDVTHSTANGTIKVDAITTADGGFAGADNVGGFVGMNFGTISYSQSNVDITGSNISHVGGFAGVNDSSGVISNSSSTGTVSVTNSLKGYAGVGYGGFVGNNSGSVESSAATGAVTITTINGAENGVASTSIGGFFGHNDGNITDSTATGAVTGVGVGTDGLGGFGGMSDGGSITGSFAGGAVSGPPGSLVAGFLGQNLFSNTQLTGNSYNPTTTGQTTAVADGARGPEDATKVDRAPDRATVVKNKGGDFGAASANGIARVQFARQVAATRAQVEQYAPQSANVVSASAAAEAAAGSPSASASTAGKKAVEARADAEIDDKLKVEEPPPPPSASAERKPRPQRHAAATPARKPQGGGHGGFGARIRSIDVDGQRYELNNGSAAPKNQ